MKEKMMNAALPKKLASYIHETGVRALDHLAEGVPQPEEGSSPDALQSLAGHWRAMDAAQKDDFVERIAVSVGEVIAASALLPAGIKVGKKAVRSARKVLKKSARTLKKKAKDSAAAAKAAKKKQESGAKRVAKKKKVSKK